jgi:CMP-N,N'-diacetyllegionaminic acid synthase
LKTLFLITARGGSKGIPRKNINALAGKPLICYSIDIARQFVSDDMICVSTDDDEIISVVENYHLKVPFKRPAELATDNASSYQVMQHALNYYNENNVFPDAVVLLQPTSPLRRKEDVSNALKLYHNDIDLVVSVCESFYRPFWFVENQDGFLEMLQTHAIPSQRQDSQKAYEYNGAIYVLNAASIKKYSAVSEFKRTRKYVMDDLHSVDIDTMLDWEFAEFLIKNGKVF